ncbi:MAG: hypothetical protein JWO43_387 [Candidatus Adlerbacteria bacterium]|nr:hypothetical protein [Candidatus Adlerbacteria bacterium]
MVAVNCQHSLQSEVVMKYLTPIVLFAAAISIIIISPFVLSNALASDNPTSIWWPTDGYHAGGPQPLKAVVSGIAIEQYDMFWQVDGGSLNPMSNNYTDAPHKEAIVDMTGWNWHGKGPYVINFVAKQNGAVVTERSITVYNEVSTETPVAPIQLTADVNIPAAATPEIIAAPAAAVSAPVVSAPAPVIAAITTTAASVPAPASAAAAPTESVQVWWPTPQTTLQGSVPLKAIVQGMPLGQYTMFWQVDGGALNPMLDNNTGAPHKEAVIDVTSWKWQQSGNYTLNFVAKDLSGNVIAQLSVPVIINPSSSQASAVSQVFTVLSSVINAPAVAPIAPVAPAASADAIKTSGNNPLSGLALYVNQYSGAAAQANAWRSSRASDASAMDTLANQPTAMWFGDWNSDISKDVRNAMSAAQGRGQAPVMVLYNIPARDCGGYSSGGTSQSGYRSWIQNIANAIGNGNAVVILEPDALAGVTCLSSTDQQTRLSLISDAVSTLKNNPNTRVYIDAGHNGWVDAATMATRLVAANISRADGFALNVSNFGTTVDNTSYGNQLSQKLNNKHFVIDTARNGNGSDGNWCNPSGRSIGQKPTTSTGNTLIDAYLWIKTPGESDGSCNGGPSAGTWWGDYALGLVRNTH